MIAREGMILAVAGLVLGVAAALAAARGARSMLFGVEPTDPLTIAAVVVSMLLVTALAAYVPARRAAGVDPVSALRR